MPISTIDCWKLLIQSGLLSQAECQQLSAQYGRAHGGQQDSAKPLLDWLIAQHVISAYQARVLLSGKDGPFQFGHYTVYDQVEQGRLTGLCRARHRETNHLVMLHFLNGSGDASPGAATNVVLPNSKHLHLVRYFEQVSLKSERFLVLEDLQGNSLDQQLRERSPMKADDACRITSAVATGVAQLHNDGLYHGDIRPANVWIEKSGNVKLIYEPERLGRQSDVSVLPARGDPKPTGGDRRSDIIGLGRLLYNLSTGEAPLVITPEFSTRVRQDLAVALPTELREVVARLTSRDANQRCTAEEVVQQLAPLLDSKRPPLAPNPPLPTESAFETWLAQQQSDSGRPPPSPPPRIAADPTIDGSGGKSALVIDTGSSGRAKRGGSSPKHRARTTRKPTNSMLIGTGVAAVLGLAILAGIYVIYLSSGAGRPPSNALDDGTAVGTTNAGSPAAPDGLPRSDASRFAVLEDDGTALWESPTDGDSSSLKYLPGGAQLLLLARLSEVAESPEGERILRSLGPGFERIYEPWLAAVGVEVREIERLVLGLYGNDGKFPRAAVVVHLENDFQPDELLGKWGMPRMRTTEAGRTYYQGDEWAYYLPAGDRVFVMGNNVEISDLADSGQVEPTLRRELAMLLQTADSQRCLNLLFAPNFLFSDGRPIFGGPRRKVLEPVERFLGDDLKGALVSAHLNDDVFFLEARLVADAAVDRSQIAAGIGERLSRLPDAVEQHIAQLDPHPHWRLVAFRFPSMVRYLVRQTRLAIEDRQLILNAALPPSGAHNLVFGTEMAMASIEKPRPIRSSRVGPRTIEEALATRLTLAFDQESLEFATQNIAAEYHSRHAGAGFELRVRILGEDLKLAGITRNQQVRDFNQSDRTLEEILTALVSAANPTKAERPSSAEQKLVWVVGPDADRPAERIILITTRDAAGRKYELPEIFQVR